MLWYCKECPRQPPLCLTGREDGFCIWHQQRPRCLNHRYSYIHTFVSVQRSYLCVINAIVYSSLASGLFLSHKLDNREAVTRRCATSCLSPRAVSSQAGLPHVSQFVPAPHSMAAQLINARNKAERGEKAWNQGYVKRVKSNKKTEG